MLLLFLNESGCCCFLLLFVCFCPLFRCCCLWIEKKKRMFKQFYYFLLLYCFSKTKSHYEDDLSLSQRNDSPMWVECAQTAKRQDCPTYFHIPHNYFNNTTCLSVQLWVMVALHTWAMLAPSKTTTEAVMLQVWDRNQQGFFSLTFHIHVLFVLFCVWDLWLQLCDTSTSESYILQVLHLIVSAELRKKRAEWSCGPVSRVMCPHLLYLSFTVAHLSRILNTPHYHEAGFCSMVNSWFSRGGETAAAEWRCHVHCMTMCDTASRNRNRRFKLDRYSYCTVNAQPTASIVSGRNKRHNISVNLRRCWWLKSVSTQLKRIWKGRSRMNQEGRN